jgi:ketosteroid isomerase-like protein
VSDSATALVQRFFDLLAAGDLDALSELLDPEVVGLGTPGGLDEHRVARGPDACMAVIRDVYEPWTRLDVTVEQLFERGDAVVAFHRETAQARGLQVTGDTATVFKLRGGRIVEMRGYLDRDAALAAAGG